MKHVILFFCSARRACCYSSRHNKLCQFLFFLENNNNHNKQALFLVELSKVQVTLKQIHTNTREYEGKTKVTHETRIVTHTSLGNVIGRHLPNVTGSVWQPAKIRTREEIVYSHARNDIPHIHLQTHVLRSIKKYIFFMFSIKFSSSDVMKPHQKRKYQLSNLLVGYKLLLPITIMVITATYPCNLLLLLFFESVSICLPIMLLELKKKTMNNL